MAAGRAAGTSFAYLTKPHLLKLAVNLPERDDEIAILARHAAGFDPRELSAAGIRPVAGAAELAAATGEAVGRPADEAAAELADRPVGWAADRPTGQSGLAPHQPDFPSSGQFAPPV
jgi:hypothetical protein